MKLVNLWKVKMDEEERNEGRVMNAKLLALEEKINELVTVINVMVETAKGGE